MSLFELVVYTFVTVRKGVSTFYWNFPNCSITFVHVTQWPYSKRRWPVFRSWPFSYYCSITRVGFFLNEFRDWWRCSWYIVILCGNNITIVQHCCHKCHSFSTCYRVRVCKNIVGCKPLWKSVKAKFISNIIFCHPNKFNSLGCSDACFDNISDIA